MMEPANRRLDIQGLRAIAVLLVMAFHSGLPLRGGFVGVDVFFVISGFVITAMLAREWDSSGWIDLPHFYTRRFLRLIPALALVVTVTLLISLFVLSPLGPQQNVVATAIGAMLLAANYAIERSTGAYFDLAAGSNPLLNTWSLSVEEQFYLLFPAVLFAAWYFARRSAQPRRAALISVAVVMGVSLIVMLIGAAGVQLPLMPDSFVGFYGPLGRAWEFAAGALLALGGNRLAVLTATRATILAGVGAVALAAAAQLITNRTTYPGLATLVPVLATVLLIHAGTHAANPVSRALGSRVLTYIGDRSYSLYLWHWPFIVFAMVLWPTKPATLIAAALLSVVPAFLSYRYVEQPLRQSSPGALPLRRLAAFALVPPLLLAAVFGVAVTNGFWLDRVRAEQSAGQLHAINLAGCLNVVPITQRAATDCTWNATASGAPVYLVGDSIAEHYAEGLIGATADLDRPLVAAVAAGCTIFLPDHLADDAEDYLDEPYCDTYRSETMRWLDSAAPGLVIIGQTDLKPWSPRSAELSRDLRYPQHALRPGLFERGLEETVERLMAAGHEVMLAQTPPSYRAPTRWQPSTCTIIQIQTGACEVTVPIAQMDLLQQGTRAAIVHVAEKTGASVFDPRSLFCDGVSCRTRLDGVELYLDDIHLSVAASELLRQQFVDAIGRA
jgi:peptidoglycan/LPS O-acetylase OafA/YrhL